MDVSTAVLTASASAFEIFGIPDDGPTGSRSFGIMGMRERVERMGGTLTVSPRPEGGTHLQADIPLGS